MAHLTRAALLFIAYVALVAARSSQSARKHMSILLVPRTGSHMIPMFALGAALVRRGHNVTVFTTTREGSDLPQRLSQSTGITLLSTGGDPLANAEDYQNYHIRKETGSSFHVLRTVVFPHVLECAGSMGRKLMNISASFGAVVPWNVIVADYWHAPYFACLSTKWGVPFISLHTSTEFLNLPHWPFPIYGSGWRDDLNFQQRFLQLFTRASQDLLLWHAKMAMVRSAAIDLHCSSDNSYHVAEGFSPLIVSSAIGFEYPRSLLPMVHYLGPLLLEEDKRLSGDLAHWLGSKTQSSVIYISMGSGARLTRRMGSALIGGILQTNYSVIWSLRASNRDILEGFSLDEEIFHISGWVPQQAVLSHKAIAMAVLHAGMGGVAEALHNEVPVIVLPMSLDQFDITARVEHSAAGAGVRLD